MKIKIDCWWTNSQQITDRLIKQFVTNKEQLDGIEFVYDNTFDYLIIFGRPSIDTIIKNPDKTFCFTMEPMWSPNNSTNLHEISNNVIVPDIDGYLNVNNYTEHLLYMLYGGHGELNFSDKEYDWTYENLNKINFNKNKNISFIVRNAYESHYNQNTPLFKTIYQDRVKIAERIINENIDVDIYGQNWLEDRKKIKGTIWNKMFGLNEYKFSIAAENTIQKNYITEKFWDCILTETIPLYFGCSNFTDHFPELVYFNFTNIIDDYSEIDKRLNYILDNADNIYKVYKPIIKKMKFDYFNSPKFNIFLKIKELIGK